MATTHHLDASDLVEIKINGELIERKTSWKVLGMEFSEHLQWNIHLKELIRSCYCTLTCLRYLKRFTPFSLRKQLAEMLILSKLDYCNCLYDSLPIYLQKRLQKV